MVGPIDYRMNVLDPIQGYLQGLKFAEDRETVRLGREATRQGMDIQAAQEARAAEAFQMQKAEAARAVAEAQRGQEVLSQLFSNPNPTSEDFTQAFVANPAIREEIKFLMDRQTAEQTRGQLVAAQNVYAAAAQGNPEVLGRILTEQRDAMAASGNEPMVKLLDEGLRLLEADPETAMQQLRASTGLTILGLGGDVQKINEAIGVGLKPAEAASPIGKIAQDVRNGIIPRSVLDTAVRLEEKQGEDGLTLQQKVAEEARLRGEYTKRTEDLSAAERNFQIIQTSAADNSGAGDIALVTSFMKMLEPSSVVQETEFAIAANAGGLLGRLQAIATKVENGQFLSPEQRADFERLAGQYLSAAQQQEGPVRESYQAIIENYGLNPVNVFGARAATQAPAGTAGAAAETPQEPAPPSFGSDPRIKALIEKYGLTAQDMWDAMTPEQRARYGK